MPQGCLQSLLHSWHNNRPIRQQCDKCSLSQWPFYRVREADQPKRDGRCPKFLRFDRADSDVTKGRHEVGGDLSRFVFGYGVWRILSPASKLEPLFAADGTHKDRQWTVRNVIERLAAIRRDKIVLGDVEFEKVTTPQPDQQTILDYLKVRL